MPIKTVRPYEILKLLKNPDLSIRVPTIPSAESRSVMMLETALLIAAAQHVEAKSILEIGTCYGYTALNLARNTDAIIDTVDPVRKDHVFDIAEQSIWYHERPSSTIHPSQKDMVFIDGDHSSDGVWADSRLAEWCGAKVIVWHDYGNPEEPEVKNVLDSFQRIPMLHVADTWLVFWFREGLWSPSS